MMRFSMINLFDLNKNILIKNFESNDFIFNDKKWFIHFNKFLIFHKTLIADGLKIDVQWKNIAIFDLYKEDEIICESTCNTAWSRLLGGHNINKLIDSSFYQELSYCYIKNEGEFSSFFFQSCQSFYFSRYNMRSRFIFFSISLNHNDENNIVNSIFLNVIFKRFWALLVYYIVSLISGCVYHLIKSFRRVFKLD